MHRCAEVCTGVRRCALVCAGVHWCAQVCVKVCGCLRVCAWDEFSEYKLGNRVPTSADFNMYPIRIFYNPGFKSVTCVVYALEEQFLYVQQPTGNKFINLGNKKIQIYFYNLG